MKRDRSGERIKFNNKIGLIINDYGEKIDVEFDDDDYHDELVYLTKKDVEIELTQNEYEKFLKKHHFVLDSQSFYIKKVNDFTYILPLKIMDKPIIIKKYKRQVLIDSVEFPDFLTKQMLIKMIQNFGSHK